MQLGGELVFTVRRAAPIRLTQAQVRRSRGGQRSACCSRSFAALA